MSVSRHEKLSKRLFAKTFAQLMCCMVLGASLLVGLVAGTQATASAASASKSPIVVGGVISATGPFVIPTIPLIPKYFQAWQNWTNAHGGIDGHPVKVITLDDGGNPANTSANITTLVKQDHAVAILNPESLSPEDVALTKSLNVPVLGGNGADPTWTTAPLWFPAGTTYPAVTYAGFYTGHLLGKTNIAEIFCAELAACATAAPIAAKYGPGIGMKVVYSTTAASNLPSYTAQCLGAKNANAQVGLIELIGSTEPYNILKQCQQQGWNPLYTQVGYVAPQSDKDQAAFQKGGEYIELSDFSAFTKTSNPNVQAYFSALNKYAPGLTTNPGYSEMGPMTWVSGQLLLAAANADNFGGISNPTGSDIIAGMYKLPAKTTLGGLTPPITFGKPGHPNPPVKCFQYQLYHAGKVTSPFGTKMFCGPK